MVLKSLQDMLDDEDVVDTAPAAEAEVAGPAEDAAITAEVPEPTPADAVSDAGGAGQTAAVENVPDQESSAAVSVPAALPRTRKKKPPQSDQTPKKSSPRQKVELSESTVAILEDVPPYLTFERKEARLRMDQVAALNVRARALNRTKNHDADRITDNTLIRVAIDLILSRAEELQGGDEAELRASLGLAEPE